MNKHLMQHVMVVLCFTCLVVSGQIDASQMPPYESAFGGVSLGVHSETGTALPFIGATGIYDIQLRDPRYSVGAMGFANFAWAGSSHALILSPMVCWGDSYDNSIFHFGVGLAMSDVGSDVGDDFTATSGVVFSAAASYTYYLQTATTEQFAINFGIQWIRDGGFMFTISPGFLTLGSSR